MAIVFISPRERQKVFILGIVAFFLIVLIIIGVSVFLIKPKKVPVEKVFTMPKITINFDVLKSPKVQSLELFPEIEKKFNYQARTEKGKDQSGVIYASSEEKARETLTELGLNSIVISEPIIGRDNPFIPYYEIKLPPVKKK